MKKILFILWILTGSVQSYAQHQWSLGLGTTSADILPSGGFVELEGQNILSDKFSVHNRVNLGFYQHRPGHTASYFEIKRGYQFHLGSSFSLEQSFGIGLMFSNYEDKYWYENEFYNLVYTGKEGKTTDIRPSVNLGLTYSFGKEEIKNQKLWLRPTAFCQLGANNPGKINFSLQLGYAYRLQKQN